MSSIETVKAIVNRRLMDIDAEITSQRRFMPFTQHAHARNLVIRELRRDRDALASEFAEILRWELEIQEARQMAKEAIENKNTGGRL